MKLLLFIFGLIVSVSNLYAQITLPAIINHNMIIQRDAKIPIWGTATPYSKVVVKFMQQKNITFADAEGRWKVIFSPKSVNCNPQKMSIETDDCKIILTNILIGEVWLCSGQSNMQFPLRKMNDAKKYIRSATNSNIRTINIYKFNFKPYECDNCRGNWVVCSPKNVYDITAVGYCFARELYEKLNIPIGLIEADFGGTKIETWTKADILKKWKWLQPALAKYDKYKNNKDFAFMKSNEKKEWFNSLAKVDKGFAEKWMLPNVETTNWQKIKLPKIWNNTNSDLSNFHGSVWMRKTIVIPDEWKYKTLIVNPGAINSRDIVWVNGKIAGMTQLLGIDTHQRNYEIRGDKFTPGTNVIVVWNYTSTHTGGMRGPVKSMRIYPEEELSHAISLAGDWLYKKGYSGINLPEPPTSLQLCYKSPTVLYNSMIAPIIPFGIRGVLWYQGESNVRAAKYYREMLGDMIKSWRREWNQGDFPFYFVQIAPYNYKYKTKSALLREAQFLSLNITNTGMAVTIDIGNANDIHPKNKIAVGHRLALWAFAKNYGFTNIVFSGPLYKSYRIAGNKIIINFDYAKGLKTYDGKSPSHFEIAGENKKFFPACAKIENDKIIVFSDKVKKPVAVRYAWSDIAHPNLCNSAGLPASSFRTDDWK